MLRRVPSNPGRVRRFHLGLRIQKATASAILVGMDPRHEHREERGSSEDVPGSEQLLERHRQGDRTATTELHSVIYGRLRGVAGRYFRNQPNDHTLQPTALVNEAYLKIACSKKGPKDRAHFLALAAACMRQILIDHARRRTLRSRHGARVNLEVCDLIVPRASDGVDMVELDDALVKLAGLSERYARIVELRFFGGLTVEDVSRVFDVSSRTIEKEWRNARAWLACELAGEGS